MTSFNWTPPKSSIVYGCSCFDRNDCHGCLEYEQHKANAYPPPKTNADKLRAMSDEELAKWCVRNVGCRKGMERAAAATLCDKIIHCDECWLDWLKEEVNE